MNKPGLADYSDVRVILSVFGEFGDGEPDSDRSAGGSGTLANNTSVGDAETLGVGGTIGYGGFIFGAGFVDLGEAGISQSDQMLGADAGEWWSVGLGYRSGLWGVSVGYYEAEIGNVAGVGDTKNTVLAFDTEYEIAPGWLLAGSLNFAEAENRDATQGDNNDGHTAIIYNIFTF